MAIDQKWRGHDFDEFAWCRSCGMPLHAIVEDRLACIPPPAVLAERRVRAAAASAPLVRLAGAVVERLGMAHGAV